MAIGERVKEWFVYQHRIGKNQADIAETWSLKPQYINQLASGTGSYGVNVINKILDFDKALNARWLLIGEGEMYVKHETEQSKSNETDFSENSTSYGLAKKKEDYRLNKLINELINQVKIKDDQIKFLQHLIEEKL